MNSTHSSLSLVRSGLPTLRYAVHHPAKTPTGAVLITHGYAEHSGRYNEVVEALTARDLIVTTYDLRGHGHSAGPRGHIDRFDDYLLDIADLIEALAKVKEWKQAGPPVLLGHSLGGLICFHAALATPGLYRAVLLSSPFFEMALAVPAAKRIAATLLSRAMPAFALPSGIRGEDVTHDAARACAYDNDPLRVPKATARFYIETSAAQIRALEQAPNFSLPLLILHAGDDKIASVGGSRKIVARVGSISKELRVLEGQYHEIFNEVERATWLQQAADAAARFCEPRLGVQGTSR